MSASEETDASVRAAQPVLVAFAAWVLPGLGYILLGQRTRGATVGVAVVSLFTLGLLIGGVRSLEVPMIDRESGLGSRNTLTEEIRLKPWSIAQFFTGPVGLVGAYSSAWAAWHKNGEEPRGAESYARVNEIAVLYTAVAGMLNLLAIIDSAHRAGRILEGM